MKDCHRRAATPGLSGQSVDDIVEDYPGLVTDDVLACAAYGAALADVRFIDIADPAA